MDFGFMFFFSAERELTGNKYRLLIEAAKFADEHEFCCVWTPERHFHKFGGLFPNPSVTSAALAMVTKRLQIRAGSLISPLHDPIRIAEEWSVVDNLSEGRVAISFGSGWNINDFVFFPERYADRHALMYEQIGIIRNLWKGNEITRLNSAGKEVSISISPKPFQKELPIWITSSGDVDTFCSAGSIGANILTHLIGQDIEALAEKIQRYREALARNDFNPGDGKVSLMLHTFIGLDLETVKAKVRHPFREYLRSAVSLEEKAAGGGGVISGGRRIDPHDISAEMMEELLDVTFERYVETAALIGTLQSCAQQIWRLKEIGVNEIACLIDFLDDHDAVMEGLRYLEVLKSRFSVAAINQAGTKAIDEFMDDFED